MKIAELGSTDGPILVFGGPYSNLQATRAMRARANDLGVAAQFCICTGDVVAYCADATGTVEEMRHWGGPVIAGNCEKQLAAGALDCGCGFEDGTTCDLLSAGWYAHANAQCDVAAREWMGGCPDIGILNWNGQRVAVLHGGITDVSRFLWPTSPEQEFQQEIDALCDLVGPVDLVLAGHSGLPFSRAIGKRQWVNAGVIGMPPHDGTPDSRYVLLNPDGGIQFHRLNYDYLSAAQAMTGAGLVQGYHAALVNGIWPSEEVLPPDLRRQSSARG